MTIIIVGHQFSELSRKQRKEHRAFSDFSRADNFYEIIATATGHKLNVQDPCNKVNPIAPITLDFPADDPPDIRLHTNGESIGIEVTDFPPHQEPLSKVSSKIAHPHSTPLFFQAGQNPNEIKQWIMPELFSQPDEIKQWAMTDSVAPRFGSNQTETQALAEHLIKKLPEKDKPTNQILLLHGAQFSQPETEAIKLAMSKVSIKYLKVIVLVLQDESIPFYSAIPIQ